MTCWSDLPGLPKVTSDVHVRLFTENREPNDVVAKRTPATPSFAPNSKMPNSPACQTLRKVTPLVWIESQRTLFRSDKHVAIIPVFDLVMQ